ncbi:MAG: hypothetical protein NT151_10930 [Acidobacteria bacterium]|nr:hypothetical protein [Acidobacteriota bacterium]
MQRLHTTRWTSTSVRGMVLVCVVGALVTACSTGGVFQRGGQAAMRGDWDMAVSYYSAALQAQPNRVEYRMALERAQIAAAQIHFDKARDMERRDQLDVALMEYRKVVEYHPGNQEARGKIAGIEQTIRDRVEAARPRPAIEAMREKARKAPAEPMLNPKSRDPIDFTFRGQLRDLLIGMGAVAGITVNFDRDFQERLYSVDLKNISFEQALQQVTAANQLFYKVLGESSIIIVPDTAQKRPAYEELAVQPFYLSHADPTDLMTLINTIVRVYPPTMQTIQPVLSASKASNVLLVRATVPMLQIIGKIIEANDKPRAEVVIDVEILEVNRSRAKQYGFELSQYQLGLTLSPESAPAAGTTSGTTTTSTPGPFNLSTVSKGVSTNDFYAAVPTGLIKFLESDTNTKVIAKPQLRGTEGETLILNLGEEVPVPSTTFTPMLSGGTAYSPMTSFALKSIGVNMELKPRVTYEGDVIIELKLEVSAQGADRNVAGQNLPSFTSRKVGTKLRLRDGESNLLAGLLREDERTSLKGLPGTLHIPILSRLFASNDNTVAQTDIVMLLTPHIVRTHELTQENFMPIYIGSQQNLGLSGPPPTLGQTTEPEIVPQAAAPPTPQAGLLAPGTVVPGPPGSPIKAVIPAGSSPIPGTVGVPAQPAAAPPAVPPAQPPQGVAPPAQQAAAPPAQPPPQVAPAAAAPSAPPPAKAEAQTQVLVGAPTTPMMVAGGPYTVPLAISGASRLSTVTLSVTFNPRVLRVRLPQEGDFMRKGGAKVTFAHKIDETAGRIDLTLTRANDTVGASGDGVVVGIIFDAIGAGTSTLTVAGVATAPGGTTVPLQFVPATVTVR